MSRKRRGTSSSTPVTPPPKVRRRSGVLIAAGIALLIGGAVAFVVLRDNAPAAPEVAATDIILVTIDTLRADTLGYAGHGRVKTPFLDSLAARGLAFDNAHAHNVVTLPSHSNILTGLLPYQHGVRDNAGFTLDPEHQTVATLLRGQGWTTAAFVGAYPLDARFGLNEGFDVYDDNYGKGPARLNFAMQERPAGAVLDAASRWWREKEGRKRFMWVHVYDPHAPYRAPEPFASQYGSERYLAEVAYVDHVLGASLRPLLSATTLVIVTSDHGEGLGEHSELTHGLFAYEPTLKVPLVMAGAGVPHRREAAHVRHIDIAPTLLAAASIPVPVAIRGTSLFEPIGSRETYFESLSASLNRGWAPLSGVITNGEKYIDLPIPELYDLASDPGEKTNLRDEKRRKVEAARRLLATMVPATAPAQRSVDAEEVARLRSLGYISGTAAPKTTYTVADDPKNLIEVNTQMNQIVETYESGDLSQALAIARDVVAKHPDMDAARELLAFVLQEMGDVPGAVQHLRAVIARGRGSADLKAQVALLLCEMGKPSEALQLISGIAKTKNPDVLNAYAVALADAGRAGEAVRQFEQLLQLDANNAPAFQNLGVVLLRHNDVAGARRHLMRAVELNPSLPLAWNTLGVVYARSDDFPNAIGAWKRAIAIDPRQHDTLFNLGMVSARIGQKEEARRALTAFVATAPPDHYAADLTAAKRALSSLQ